MAKDYRFGQTSLHEACENNEDTEIVADLIENGDDVNVFNSRGFTPLHYACENANLQLASLLVSHRANVNANPRILDLPCEDPWSPIHAVAYSLCRGEENVHVHAVVELLLKNGADVNAFDYRGCTPLHYACENANPQLVSLLVTHMADVNANPRILDLACENPSSPIHAAFRSAVKRLHEEDEHAVVELLLKNGADVNDARTKNGESPLHFALPSHSYPSVVKLLTNHGANVNQTDHKGHTPLCVATYHCSSSTGIKGKLLIDKGAKLCNNSAEQHLIDCQLILDCKINFFIEYMYHAELVDVLGYQEFLQLLTNHTESVHNIRFYRRLLDHTLFNIAQLLTLLLIPTDEMMKLMRNDEIEFFAVYGVLKTILQLSLFSKFENQIVDKGQSYLDQLCFSLEATASVIFDTDMHTTRLNKEVLTPLDSAIDFYFEMLAQLLISQTTQVIQAGEEQHSSPYLLLQCSLKIIAKLLVDKGVDVSDESKEDEPVLYSQGAQRYESEQLKTNEGTFMNQIHDLAHQSLHSTLCKSLKIMMLMFCDKIAGEKLVDVKGLSLLHFAGSFYIEAKSFLANYNESETLAKLPSQDTANNESFSNQHDRDILSEEMKVELSAALLQQAKFFNLTLNKATDVADCFSLGTVNCPVINLLKGTCYYEKAYVYYEAVLFLLKNTQGLDINLIRNDAERIFSLLSKRKCLDFDCELMTEIQICELLLERGLHLDALGRDKITNYEMLHKILNKITDYKMWYELGNSSWSESVTFQTAESQKAKIKDRILTEMETRYLACKLSLKCCCARSIAANNVDYRNLPGRLKSFVGIHQQHSVSDSDSDLYSDSDSDSDSDLDSDSDSEF